MTGFSIADALQHSLLRASNRQVPFLLCTRLGHAASVHPTRWLQCRWRWLLTIAALLALQRKKVVASGQAQQL